MRSKFVECYNSYSTTTFAVRASAQCYDTNLNLHFQRQIGPPKQRQLPAWLHWSALMTIYLFVLLQGRFTKHIPTIAFLTIRPTSFLNYPPIRLLIIDLFRWGAILSPSPVAWQRDYKTGLLCTMCNWRIRCPSSPTSDLKTTGFDPATLLNVCESDAPAD